MCFILKRWVFISSLSYLCMAQELLPQALSNVSENTLGNYAFSLMGIAISIIVVVVVLAVLFFVVIKRASSKSKSVNKTSSSAIGTYSQLPAAAQNTSSASPNFTQQSPSSQAPFVASSVKETLVVPNQNTNSSEPFAHVEISGAPTVDASAFVPSGDVSLKDMLLKKFQPKIESQLGDKIIAHDIRPADANFELLVEVSGVTMILLVDASGKILDYKKVRQ